MPKRNDAELRFMAGIQEMPAMNRKSIFAKVKARGRIYAAPGRIVFPYCPLMLFQASL